MPSRMLAASRGKILFSAGEFQLRHSRMPSYHTIAKRHARRPLIFAFTPLRLTRYRCRLYYGLVWRWHHGFLICCAMDTACFSARLPPYDLLHFLSISSPDELIHFHYRRFHRATQMLAARFFDSFSLKVSSIIARGEDRSRARTFSFPRFSFARAGDLRSAYARFASRHRRASFHLLLRFAISPTIGHCGFGLFNRPADLPGPIRHADKISFRRFLRAASTLLMMGFAFSSPRHRQKCWHHGHRTWGKIYKQLCLRAFRLLESRAFDYRLATIATILSARGVPLRFH